MPATCMCTSTHSRLTGCLVQLKYGISIPAAETASTVHTVGPADRNAYTRHGMHKPIAGVGKPTGFAPGPRTLCF